MENNYIFQADYKNKQGEVKVKLLLVSFKDKQQTHFVYSPHLDLTGYGDSIKEAKESFGIVFNDFIEYTLNKNTLAKVLTKLGWTLKGTVKKPKKILAPSMQSIVNTDYISEIFDRYPVKTFHKEVGIPAYI